MAFKKVDEYLKDKQGNFFVLRNDGDSADVIFLYRSREDMVVCSTHYIKSDQYSGYVHCLGAGCPACAKDIRRNDSLFIPVYNIVDDEIQYIDKGTRWEGLMQENVFRRTADPSSLVFAITRHNRPIEPGQRYPSVVYSIMAKSTNTVKSFDVLVPNPDPYVLYGDICRQVDAITMSDMLATRTNSDAGVPLPEYTPIPRVSPAAVTSDIRMPDFDSMGDVADISEDDLQF